MSSDFHPRAAARDDRPDFMVLLGLNPPYDVESVKQAYLQKARTAHPDRGGDPADFKRLQEAFERATEFATFKASRLRWLGAQVERYARQEELIVSLREQGATVETERIDWLRHSFGDDFAQIAERIVSITMPGERFGDEDAARLAILSDDLAALAALDFSGSRLTDRGLSQLTRLSGLRKLNLAKTRVTNAGVPWLARFAAMRWLGLQGTGINWWGRFRLRRALSELEIHS